MDLLGAPQNNNWSILSEYAPYFLVTKLEAFDGRGRGDYQMSHDMEDLIAVLDGRPELADEIAQAEIDLAQALRIRFRALLDSPQFVDAVSGHMPTDAASQARVPLIMRRIERLAAVS